MMSGSLPKRYARALFQIAKEEKAVESLGRELETLVAVLTSGGSEEAPNALHVLANDHLSHSERLASADEIGDKLGLNIFLKNFLSLLVQKERISLLSDIAREYRDFQDELLDIVRVTVTTPQAPSQDLLQSVEKILSQKLSKKIIARGVQDASLLGGMVLEVGHTLYDGSVRRELEKVQESILKG
jgi:F-type H+-transporting ATPase subunit delta